MADGTTTYGDISPRTAAWAATEALRHATPVECLAKFALIKPIPRNSTQTVKFRRAVPFTAATVPLQEGVTPTAQKMAFEDVQATLKQYGVPIEITDVVEDTHEDPVLQIAMEIAGEQAALTKEKLLYGVMKAGTNVYYANGSARNAVNTAVTLNKLRAVVRGLQAQKADKIRRMVSGSPKVGTTPIEQAYVAFCHTDVTADIRGLAGFTPVSQYGSMQIISEHEVGAVEDIRFLTSPELNAFADAGGSAGSMISTTGSNADVYPILIVGKDSYAHVPLRGAGGITPMVVNPNKPSGSDPLGQRGYVSWKCYDASLILNQNWMARLEVAATDL